MSEKILVNVMPGETRVALIEDNIVQEVHIERKNKPSLIGNIYKAKVVRVLPGIQAAFVDIGLERTAFLHQNEMLKGAVTDGQEILVQVIKDPISTKGARLSMQVSISSRYLVLSPYTNNINVSLRIADPLERERLKKMLNGDEASNYGFIIRTAAEGLSSLDKDLHYLQNQWDKITSNYANATAVALVYQDLSLALRIFRDLASNNTALVKIDSSAQMQELKNFATEFAPDFKGEIESYTEAKPIFDLYSVDEEISKALQNKVPLKSGGHLIIEQTEAMTTIDVNTGAFVGYKTLEETVYKTNLEAAHVIARQIRLRNLGGIIIIDFIDMSELAHRDKLLQALEKDLARDYIKTNISELTRLGLVQMTRKRTRESLQHNLCEPCGACNGRGYVNSIETVCFNILREISRLVEIMASSAVKLLIIAAPAVVDKLSAEYKLLMTELEKSINKIINLQAEPLYPQEQFDMVLL